MKKLFSIAIFAAMMLPAFANEPAENSDVEYGRTVTKYASTPKFGGYFIGKYDYSDKSGAKGGTGFSQRLIRAYVDGTILNDFKYRVQIQMCDGNFHMKDVFVEWQKYNSFRVKAGQFKRAFGFENPMNPWDISTGDYSLFTKNMTSDYKGAGWAGGGRDMGIQIQGDFLPVGKDNHNLFHYQVGLWNGQGINTKDVDRQKDLIGTFQVQPIKNLYIGFFGMHGTYGTQSLEKNRYAFGAKYDSNGWTARAEWGHGQYGPVQDDAWYVVGGMPVNSWLRLCAQYQCYRSNENWETSQNIFSFIPEFQIHKNLKLQLQYNYNDNRAQRFVKKGDVHYSEVWAELYVRF